MRALLLVRSDLKKRPGGDTTQILETAAALRRRGVAVEISSAADPDLRRFDLVHLFHLGRVWENVHWCRLIRAAGIPSALSPIYWPTEKFDRFGRTGLGGALSRLGGAAVYHDLRAIQRAARSDLRRGSMRTLGRMLLGHEMAQRFVLDTVGVVLPNSRAECDQLKHRFCSVPPLFVVPNAVNTTIYAGGFAEPHPDADDDGETVLCVGRIEPRKNQLMLIRALKNSGLRLRIIGRPGDLHRAYERQCRREAGPDVDFLSWRTPHELRHWYRTSGAHVSPSWYETPGLASLEAAYCECPIVVTPEGSTREYFGDAAEYCSPDDAFSIRSAVERALSRPTFSPLSKKIGDRYTWEVAALETLLAYDRAAGEHPETT